jgi:hypothetical protein
MKPIKIFSYFVLGVFLGMVFLIASMYAQAAEPATVTAWTKVIGCPIADHITYTQTLPLESQYAVKHVLGELKGRVFTFSCGVLS